MEQRRKNELVKLRAIPVKHRNPRLNAGLWYEKKRNAQDDSGHGRRGLPPGDLSWRIQLCRGPLPLFVSAPTCADERGAVTSVFLAARWRASRPQMACLCRATFKSPSANVAAAAPHIGILLTLPFPAGPVPLYRRSGPAGSGRGVACSWRRHQLPGEAQPQKGTYAMWFQSHLTDAAPRRVRSGAQRGDCTCAPPGN